MRIRIIMMLKDEDDLVLPWLKYHGALVGHENLTIFDNGSTSARTLAGLEWGEQAGARVDRSQSTTAQFVKRGKMYARLIKAMDKDGAADFYFPLDCDEFLAVEADGVVRCDRASLEAELEPYRSSAHPLLISAGLDNHPKVPGVFRRSPDQRKTFFAAGACESLDHGFHSGRSRQGLDGVKTRVVYLHYHFKPYPILVEHSKAKIAPFTTDFSEENMRRYVHERRSAFHCAVHLLRSEADYYRSFEGSHFIDVPQFRQALAAVGEGLPFA